MDGFCKVIESVKNGIYQCQEIELSEQELRSVDCGKIVKYRKE